MEFLIEFVLGIPTTTWLRASMITAAGAIIMHLLYLRRRARVFLITDYFIRPIINERLESRARDWRIYQSFVVCWVVLFLLICGIVATL